MRSLNLADMIRHNPTPYLGQYSYSVLLKLGSLALGLTPGLDQQKLD